VSDRVDEPRDRDRVVLITGAAGGLGRALVEAFLGAGWQVVGGVHRSALVMDHARLATVSLDVTSSEGVGGAVKRVLELRGRVDVLVNNAGVTADAAIWQASEAEWNRVVAVNLGGAMRCAREVGTVMARQGTGHILNIGSFAARWGTAGQAAYAAAKAGLIGLTQSLARELGSRNICVNVVLPGVLRTRMTEGLTEARLVELAEANALGRLNTLDEVARFVAYVAAMENVSGQVFQLDSRVSRWS
jgi:3-oxoacyl-[acyl-carrier protein] reductase